ncbi:glycosyltransferase [Cohnella sp. CFH 77786]|uniref:glycosyltransferase family 2 protein n=1 Tax=Cohnella sp. CFH 77786 TaxID=2662265 RepID=UPI001C60D9B8|nr:glycosyltransferase family 2 protein [Cohnella sp. CFH 77786]MBW5447382.1 glycosyltransferase [Cohnella sp. CFH 77786]
MTAVPDMDRKDDSHDSFRRGFEEGYRQGLLSGGRQYGTLFDGTSIIIPTYNQLHFLKKCLRSIEEHTESPYEIVVVDNASSDGTAEYLQSLRGQVRFRILETNQGFSGAVNVGLMMSKGRTIALLNNDTVVTEKWLRNLLYCLNSDPGTGMVGPVTNYISGEQKIHVHYRKLEEMHAFARKHNHRRPAMWRDSDWLRGFCLVFRRELFEEIGYFDEGFEIGNFEDNDYNIRVRLAGKRLVIAGDTFIHHFGSVSMRALGSSLFELNHRNESYYAVKWNDPIGWVQRAVQHAPGYRGELPAGALYYPQRVAVKGIGDAVYWIEQGQRHPVEGSLSFPVVQVSQVDLRRWPVGEPIKSTQAERSWRGLDDPAGWGAGVAILPDGQVYHVEGNTVRRVISITAMHSWQLHVKPARLVAENELSGRESGPPIIPLPKLKQRL